jgi:hypothetical protein
VSWTKFRVQSYGLEIAPQLAALATGLEFVPRSRRRELVERLLGWCERLVVGVLNEHESEHTTEVLLRSFGFRPTGTAGRPHPRKHGVEYRIVWLDS